MSFCSLTRATRRNDRMVSPICRCPGKSDAQGAECERALRSAQREQLQSRRLLLGALHLKTGGRFDCKSPPCPRPSSITPGRLVRLSKATRRTLPSPFERLTKYKAERLN